MAVNTDEAPKPATGEVIRVPDPDTTRPYNVYRLGRSRGGQPKIKNAFYSPAEERQIAVLYLRSLTKEERAAVLADAEKTPRKRPAGPGPGPRSSGTAKVPAGSRSASSREPAGAGAGQEDAKASA